MRKSENRAFWHDGLHFECTSCGHCCRHEPGYVFLTETDLKSLAAFKGLDTQSFSKKYCRKVDLGLAHRLSLTETRENDCIFWDNGCTVYDARPLQCRTYPFWAGVLASQSDWDREGLECPGIGQGRRYSRKEIEAALAARENEVLISPA